MTDLKSKLSDLELSNIELSDLQGFDPRFIEDYLSMKDDILAIAAHVEPPAGDPPGLLRDDLNGVNDILTAPTSNQAYILDQKIASNAQLHSDHANDIDNPHSTIFTDLDDVDTESLNNLSGFSVFVSSAFKLIVRKIFALDIFFDDKNIGSGVPTVQELLEIHDDQIGLRETAATGIIDGGGGAIVDATNITVNAGNGEIVDGYTDRRDPVRTNVSWLAVPSYAISMPDIIGVQVVFTDATGVIQQQSMPLSESQRRSIVQIAFVYYRNGSIVSMQHAGIHSNEVGNTLYDLIYRLPFASRTAGMGVRAVTNALSVFADEGTFFSPGISTSLDLTNPNIGQFPPVGDINTPMVFDVIFADGSTVPGLSAQTTIPKFYESAPNVSTALSGNDATIGYLFKTFGNTYLFQLGTNLYTNGALARDSLDIDLDSHVFFAGSENTLPSAQVYNDRTSTDFNDANKSGIVSLIGSGAGPSGSVDVTNWIDLTDVNATAYTGNASKYSKVEGDESGLNLFDLTIIDDVTPKLGGELGTQANEVIIQSDATTEVGRMGNTVGGGVFLTKTANGVYNPNDGGVAAEAGIVALHGGIAQVKTLAGIDNREVWVNSDGSLFSVTPPPPGFTVSDTDNANYPLAGLGVFVQITGLQVIIPQAVAAGKPLKMIANIHIVNGSSSRGGTIDIAMGINGAAPTDNGINAYIAGALNAVVPISVTTTSHGGLAINDTVEVWVRRSTEEHNQFDPNANALIGALHEMAVSNESSGSAAVSSVDGRTGTVTLSDLYLSLITGGIVTGNITVDSITGNSDVIVKGNLSSSIFPGFLIADENSNTIGSFSQNISNGDLFLDRWSSAGALITRLILTNDGNVAISGALPINADHLARKDFVELRVKVTDNPNTRANILNRTRSDLSNKGAIDTDGNGGFIFSSIGTDTLTLTKPLITAHVDMQAENITITQTPAAPGHAVRKDFAESLQDLGVRTATGTTTTLLLTDRAGAVECANPAAINLVIDNTTTTNYPIGMQCVIVQADVGQVSVTGAVGVSIVAPLGQNKTAVTDDAVTIYHSANNIWRVFGGAA